MPAGSPEWTGSLTWPLRPADSRGSEQTDSPGSMPASPGRRPGSPDWPTAPGKSRRQAESLGSAPARPTREEAALRARLQTKPAASCDRTRHEARRSSCARQTDSLCTLRLPICRRHAISRHWRWLLAHYDACAPKAKAAPRGGLWEGECAFGFHSMPGESRLLRDRRKPATPRPHTQSAISAHADDSEDA